MDEVDGSVRSAIGLLGMGSLFYVPSKEIEADALMAPLTISVRFQARKISLAPSHRAIDVRFFGVCHHSQ